MSQRGLSLLVLCSRKGNKKNKTKKTEKSAKKNQERKNNKMEKRDKKWHNFLFSLCLVSLIKATLLTINRQDFLHVKLFSYSP